MGFYLTIIRVLVVGSALLATNAYAEAKDDALLILEQLGFKRLVSDVPEILQNSISQRRKETGLSEEQYQRVLALYTKAYAPQDILDSLALAVSKKVSSQDLSTLKNLLATEQAQQLQALREQAAGEQGIAAIRELAKAHQSEPVSKNRQTLLETFDEAAADTEFFIAMQALTVYGIMRGFNTLGKNAAENNTGPDALLQLIYEQLQRPTRYTIAMTLRYTFRELDDQEVMGYVQLYRFAPLHQFLVHTMEQLRLDMLRRASLVKREL